MRLFENPAGQEERDKELDLFEYPASMQWRVPPPRRSLLMRVALVSIPVLLVTVLLILFGDLPVADSVGGIGQVLSPLIRLLLFIASPSFIFPSLLLTFVLHRYFFVNRIVARHMLFVILAVAASGVVSYVLNLALRAIFLNGPFAGPTGFPVQLEDGLFPALPAVLIAALTTSFFLTYPRFRMVCLSIALAVAGACILGGVYHLSGVFLGVYLGLLLTLLTQTCFEHWMGRL